MEQTDNNSYILLHYHICLGKFLTGFFYLLPAKCPVQAVSQTMITQSILQELHLRKDL